MKDNSEFGCIIFTCRHLFYNSFQNFHVEFNKRQANVAAHELTHVASYNASSHIYTDVPSCI